nr:disease resistance protein RPP5-like [Quercus suber]
MGIQTFIDNNLPRGENISEELLKVIENSSASIIVFSKNYASSSWCLDELAKIIECSEKVIPVFYQVDPSEVAEQTGNYGKELTKHEETIKDKTKVQRWRQALSNAANISGWDHKNSCTESELIEKIVEEILNFEFIQMPSNDATMEPVGINSRIEAVTKLLDIESNDVRMVGITGLGGIGKTTIAKAIYNSFSNRFKAKSFLENVREWSKTDQGIIHLQETLLKGVSKDKNLRVNTIYEGKTRINKILRLKKVLIILDDVDNADQIETLLGQCECFAFGSRIILTTRYKSLLVNRNGLSTYDYGVKELDEDEAIELFRKHAFPRNEVPEDYLELEKQAISYAKGLPLALKDVLKACGLYPVYGIRKLIDKCLLTIDQYNYYLLMHDLLQQMGMDIVRQEALKKPGERSRLWRYKEALDVVTKNMNFVSLTNVDFSWCNLIMKIPNLSTAPNITQLILEGCRNLVEIDDSVGHLDKLEVWDLFQCQKLETLPNCLTMKSLRYFDLLECERIKKFPNILHKMKGVQYLNLEGNCTNELPPSFGNLIGLEGLIISSDSGEARLPSSIYNLQHIKELQLAGDFIFPKNVEIDRQPMCNSLGCSSKYK